MTEQSMNMKQIVKWSVEIIMNLYINVFAAITNHKRNELWHYLLWLWWINRNK